MNASNHDIWGARVKLAFAVFAMAGAFFLLAEHRAHVLPWLPWLVLAACPLMHFFMHRGHDGHAHHGDRAASDETPNATPESSDVATSGPGSPASRSSSGHRHGGRP